MNSSHLINTCNFFFNESFKGLFDHMDKAVSQTPTQAKFDVFTYVVHEGMGGVRELDFESLQKRFLEDSDG